MGDRDAEIVQFAGVFATHDPDVEWPSEKHTDPVDAICAAVNRLRERANEGRCGSAMYVD